MASVGYTRQSSFVDGDTITSDLFNNEYNQLVNAFTYSSTGTTGHQHDGTAGEGGNIPQIGDQDFLNKVVVDTSNNRVGFFVEVSSSAVEQIRVQDGAIVPVTNNDIDLGTSSLQFKDAFFDGTVEADALTINGTTLAETISDTVGAMVSSNTETNITVSYDDSDNTLDFVVGTLNQDTTGNAATATALETARDFSLTGNVTASAISFSGTGNVALSTTIGSSVVTNAMLAGSIANAKLANSTVSFGGISLALGASDATPAFDLTDATNYPTSSLSGTITNAQLAGSIANAKLANSSVSYGGVSLALGATDATPAFDLTDATNYPTSSLTGTITNAQLAGSIANAKLANSSITVTDGSNSTATALGGTITFAAGEGLDVGESSGTVTFSAEDATASNKGVASFDSTDFSVSSGAVTLQAERIQDIVGGMVSSNTESGITVAYEDSDGTLDFTVGTLNQDTTGNAATATALETARTIHGVSFDGTANIDLTEVVQDTVGAMVSSNTESGITVAYQDSDGTLDFTVGTLNQDTTGTSSKVVVTDSTANTNFPVVFHDESNSLLDDTGALRYNPSTGELLVPNLTVAGTTTTVNTVTMNAENAIVFEGATADSNETTLTITDPTADRTITLPDATGTVALTSITDENFTTTLKNKLDAIEASATADQTAEEIQDIVGAMFTSNTETGITATYQDSDGTIDLVTDVSSLSAPTITSPKIVGEISIAPSEATTQTLTVTVASKTSEHPYDGGSSNAYVIDSVESPYLTLVPDTTYRFDQADSSNSGHPLRFYYESDKTTAYTTGVTTNGTPGSAGAYTEIKATASTPTVLFYQCSSHALMGNRVNFDTRNLTGFATGDLVTSGSVTNSMLANSSVSYGGISLALGASDGTPAFDLSDATNYPTSSLSGTITNAQLAGSIANSKLANSSITVSDGSSSTATALGGTITFSGTSNEVEVGESSGTITVGLPSATQITTSLGVGGGSTNGVQISQGAIAIKNGGTQSYIDFYCENNNAHYARIQAPAHSALNATGGNITLTLPATTDTLVGKTTTDTLTNKSLTDPVLTGSSSSAGKILFKEDTDNGTNAVTLIGPASTGDVTVTLPSSAGTLALTSDITSATDSFKTISVSGQTDVVADSSTDTLTLVAGANTTITTDASSDTITITSAGSGSAEANQNAFSNVAVSGQTTVAADSQTDTLTLVAGSNVTLTTDASADSVTIAAASGSSGPTKSAKTSAYTVVAGDNGNLIDVDSGDATDLTISLTAAATLGSGFHVYIRNSNDTAGSSQPTVTIDPNGSETIDGLATVKLNNYQIIHLVCDGSNFFILNEQNRGIATSQKDTSFERPNAEGPYSIAIGSGSRAESNNGSYSFGNHADALGNNSLALGYQAQVSGIAAVGIGYTPNASGTFSTAIGYNATSSGDYSSALTNSRAAGSNSFAAAIGTNSSSYGATNTHSIAMGNDARASGTHSLSIGDGSQATSSNSVAIGYSTEAVSTGGHAFGYDARSGGNYSVALGKEATTGATDSVSIGKEAYTNVLGKIAFSSGEFSDLGDCQEGLFVLKSDTTNATAEKMTTDNNPSSADSGNQVQVRSYAALAFHGMVVCRQQSADGTDCSAWRVEGLARRENAASTTTLVNSAIHTINNATNLGLAISADTTNGAVSFTVTGEASHDLRWVGTIHTTETYYQ